MTSATGSIRTAGLGRTYRLDDGRRLEALTNVDLAVDAGEVVGLLGPNGAGKTTLSRILVALLAPTSGRAEVAGLDVVAQPRQVKRACGVSFGGDLGLYPRISAYENLRYFALMNRLPRRAVRLRIDELLDRVQLSDRRDDKVETFSRRMRQRLHLARALLHDPSVLILDEPSAGLDPAGARQLRTMIRNLPIGGRSVLITTHDLTEAEEVCDRVVVLDQGRVVGQASPYELRRRAVDSLGVCIELPDAKELATEVLDRVPGVRRVARRGGVLRIYTTDAGPAISFLVDELGIDTSGFHVSPPSLEDAYLELVAA